MLPVEVFATGIKIKSNDRSSVVKNLASLEQPHKGGVAMILYLECRKCDQVSERNNQAIEDHFTNQDS